MTESRYSSSGRPRELEGIRDVLRGGSLARSLSAVPAEDRLSAAWTVICGRALAGRASVAAYHGGVVTIEIIDATWRAQLLPMAAGFAHKLAAASGIPVQRIQFALRGRPQS